MDYVKPEGLYATNRHPPPPRPLSARPRAAKILGGRS